MSKATHVARDLFFPAGVPGFRRLIRTLGLILSPICRATAVPTVYLRGPDAPATGTTPNSASKTHSPTAMLPPQPQTPGCASLAAGLFCLKTRDSKQAGRLFERAHLLQTPIRKPFAYQPPGIRTAPQAGVSLAPLPSCSQSKMIPPPPSETQEEFLAAWRDLSCPSEGARRYPGLTGQDSHASGVT